MRPGSNAKSSEGASRFESAQPYSAQGAASLPQKDLPEHLSVRDAMLAVAKLEGGNSRDPEIQDGDTINHETGIGSKAKPCKQASRGARAPRELS